MEHGAIAFLLVSQWNRVEKCDEFQDSNHQATISKDYWYRGKIHIYTPPLFDEIITIRVIGIPRWEKCMLIHNARLYHDVLLSRNGKWNAWTIAPHSAHIYIYTRESRLLWWKESRSKMKLGARKLCRIFNRNTGWRLRKYSENSLSIFPWD